MEIERKFLIKALPENLSSYQKHVIEQAYLCTDPVIRIRRQDHDYYLTYKGKGLLSREEYNLPLNEAAPRGPGRRGDGFGIFMDGLSPPCFFRGFYTACKAPFPDH